jgi:peptide deformylase
LAVLPIYVSEQSTLRKRARAIKQTSEAIRRLGEDMLETMHKANGIGLAANQVGLLQRIIVVDVSEMEEFKTVPPMIMVNPEIIAASGECTMEEGCLSIPEVREEVARPEAIRVRYRDTDFEPYELDATGMLARVIMHEIDHLNGVLFIDHIGGLKRKLLRGRLNKIHRGDIEVSYPIVADTDPVVAQR